MRLLELDLERYGPFTGRKLTFRPDATLHVVYGANEAGKSSALAAVTDLLFGIEPRTAYDFLHDGKDMRIGAGIAARDGRKLAFRRRKGNKNTLIDAQDAPLGDDALAPFLGGLTREIFGRAFGLNAESLRAGAQDMLRNDGDVGASLFAAASGLRGLTELRGRLDDEAAAIFAPRASKDRTFYQALERFETARKSIRERELRAGDWRDLNDKIDRLAADLDEIKSKRKEAAAAQARLERLKRVAPVLRAIDDHLARLKAFDDLPDPAPDFSARLRQRLDTLDTATEAARAAATAAEKTQADWAAIAVDDDLLAHADEVQSLLQATGKFAKDRQDLPRVQAEADEYAASLAQSAKRLGLADARAVEQSQPTDAALALARKLSGELKTLASDLARLRGALKSERDGLADIERQRTARGALTDPKHWQERFAALAPVLKQMETRAQKATVLRGETRDLQEAAARLRPAADLDVLANTALPDAALIGRFREQSDTLRDERRRETDRLATAEQILADLAQQLRGLAAGRPVASAQAIAAARAARDAQWSALRASLFGEAGGLSGAALAATVAAYERDVGAADRLADEAASDAARIAGHASVTIRLADEQRKADAAQHALTALQARAEREAETWRAAWPGLTPGTATDMAQWLPSVEALLERRRKLMAAQDEIAALDASIAQAVPDLRALAGDLGLGGENDAVLAKLIETRLGAVAEAWNAARDLDARRGAISDTVARLEHDEQAASNNQAELMTRWQAAAAGIGLLANATPDEAEAALLAWSEVPGIVRERDNRGHRVTGLTRDIDAFAAQASELVAALATDLAALPPDAAAKSLSERLAKAQTAQTRQTEAANRRDEAMRATSEAEVALQQAQAALRECAAVLPAGADLDAMAARLAEREDVRADLAAQRWRLTDVADGHAEAALRADLAGCDPDRASAELAELGRHIEALDEDGRRIYSEHREALRERTDKEQGVGAEVAVQQKQGAQAELADLARDWSVTRLASLLIARAVERHRAQQSDPLMARAGALFAMLTENSFIGVAQQFGDDDTPRLVGRRAAGDPVAIDHMSEGARDQLFLALRLAYLEDYAGHAEPAPFIADDIFASFDEARVARGLAALAQIGGTIQPIVFTHHRHVADIARDMAGADVIMLERS